VAQRGNPVVELPASVDMEARAASHSDKSGLGSCGRPDSARPGGLAASESRTQARMARSLLEASRPIMPGLLQYAGPRMGELSSLTCQHPRAGSFAAWGKFPCGISQPE